MSMERPTKEYSRTQLNEAIDEWIVGERNDYRNREMLRMWFVDGRSIEYVAEKFGLTPRAAQSIIWKAKMRLFKHL